MRKIIDIIKLNCLTYKENNAFSVLLDTGFYRTYTYGQLLEYAISYSLKLIDSGVSEGDRIALIAENSPEWVISYLSILLCKCTPVLIDSSLANSELTEFVQISDVRGIMMSPNVRSKFLLAPSLGIPTYNLIDKANPFTGDPAELSPDHPSTSDPDSSIIAIIYSSGTTSTSKGVMFCDEGVITTTERNIISNRLTPNYRFLAVIPLNHIYGYMAMMMCPLLCGGCVCFIESTTSENLSKAFLSFKPNGFCGVPRIFELFSGKITNIIASKGRTAASIIKALLKLSYATRKLTGLNLGKIIFRSVHQIFGGSVIAFMSAGSILDKQTVSLFYSFGFNLLNNYGITETNIPIAANTFTNYTLDTCGQVFNPVQVAINQPNAQGIGEILVKSPGMMKGYFRDETATKTAFDSSGWFLTGDLGYFDKNQNLLVTGRIKENIVLDTGKKVAPDDIEKAYSGISGISDLVVCGVPKKKQAYDEIHAFLIKDILSGRENAQIEADIWEINSRLPNHMRISKIHFLDSIPKTSLQKPKRYLLKELALSTSVTIRKTACTHEDFTWDHESANNFNIIRNLFSTFGFNEDILQSKTRLFEDLGFDSLSVTEFSLELEHKTGVEIASFLKPNITVEDILHILKDHKSSANNTVAQIAQFPLEKKLIGTIGYRFFKALFQSIYKIEIKGQQNLPKKGGYLICPNHETHIDAFFVLFPFSDNDFQRFCCLAKKEHLSNFLGRMMLRIAGGIPVDRFGNPTPALARCNEKLNEGSIVLIHPEGTRTNDGTIGEFKKGAAKLSIDTGVPIIPVRIKGGFEIYPKDKLLPKVFNLKKMQRYCVQISYGEALLPVGHDTESLTAALRNRILAL